VTSALDEMVIPEITFSSKRFVLEGLCSLAASVVPTREGGYPLLSNFLVDVSPERLRVAATDLDLSLLAESELVSAEGTARLLFPAKRMTAILREVAEGDITIEVKQAVAHIRAGSTSWSIRLQPALEFPALPDPAAAEFHEVSRAKFLKTLLDVKPAIGRDGTNIKLMVVDVAGGRFTACDGGRLHRVAFEGFPLDMRIPAGAVTELCRILKDADTETVGVARNEQLLLFRVGDYVFTAGDASWAYPNMDTQVLVPALENKRKLTVNTAALAAAVRRVRINADAETSAIGLRISKGAVVVTTRDKAGNGASEEIEAGWDGNAPRLAVVNHQFLTDLLLLCPGPAAELWLPSDGRGTKPILLRGDETGVTGVIQQMPASLIGE
jgi:DNA polymerase III subunit beta